jgi:hypothetical protein
MNLGTMNPKFCMCGNYLTRPPVCEHCRKSMKAKGYPYIDGVGWTKAPALHAKPEAPPMPDGAEATRPDKP